MKKSIIFLILTLILINIVSAGQTLELDFKKNPSYIIGLLEGDRVEFDLQGSKHTVLVKNINTNAVELATFTFVDKLNPPFYSTINNKKYLKLDLNRDDIDDLYVLYKDSNLTAASLIFQLPLSANKDIKIFSENQFSQSNYLVYIIYLIVVLIIAALIIHFKKSKEKKLKDTEKNDKISDS